MNRSLLTVLLVLVAGSSVQARRRPGDSGSSSQSECIAALAPTEAEAEQLQAAVVTCIAEQDGLQDIIDELGAPDLDSRRGGGGQPGEKCQDIAALLEANDYTTEASALRECLAREMDLLADDGTVDMEALQTSISDKVSNLTIEANTQLGLDNCADVEDFDIVEYLGCIIAYCETGAEP